jgi:hypothetical protein
MIVAKLREAATRQFADPENRQRHSDIALAQFADPEKRQRHKDAHNTPEFKARVSELHSNTIWINDGKTNRHLKDDVPVPDGWSLGVVNYGSTPDARKNAQLIGRHNRWHARRGITNPDCALCAETLSDAKEVGT